MVVKPDPRGNACPPQSRPPIEWSRLSTGTSSTYILVHIFLSILVTVVSRPHLCPPHHPASLPLVFQQSGVICGICLYPSTIVLARSIRGHCALSGSIATASPSETSTQAPRDPNRRISHHFRALGLLDLEIPGRSSDAAYPWELDLYLLHRSGSPAWRHIRGFVPTPASSRGPDPCTHPRFSTQRSKGIWRAPISVSVGLNERL